MKKTNILIFFAALTFLVTTASAVQNYEYNFEESSETTPKEVRVEDTYSSTGEEDSETDEENQEQETETTTECPVGQVKIDGRCDIPKGFVDSEGIPDEYQDDSSSSSEDDSSDQDSEQDDSEDNSNDKNPGDKCDSSSSATGTDYVWTDTEIDDTSGCVKEEKYCNNNPKDCEGQSCNYASFYEGERGYYDEEGNCRYRTDYCNKANNLDKYSEESKSESGQAQQGRQQAEKAEGDRYCNKLLSDARSSSGSSNYGNGGSNNGDNGDDGDDGGEEDENSQHPLKDWNTQKIVNKYLDTLKQYDEDSNGNISLGEEAEALRDQDRGEINRKKYDAVHQIMDRDENYLNYVDGEKADPEIVINGGKNLEISTTIFAPTAGYKTKVDVNREDSESNDGKIAVEMSLRKPEGGPAQKITPVEVSEEIEDIEPGTYEVSAVAKSVQSSIGREKDEVKTKEVEITGSEVDLGDLAVELSPEMGVKRVRTDQIMVFGRKKADFSVENPDTGEEYLAGDVTMDNKINNEDAQTAKRNSQGDLELYRHQLELADTNKDGEVNQEDISMISNLATGSDKLFENKYIVAVTEVEGSKEETLVLNAEKPIRISEGKRSSIADHYIYNCNVEGAVAEVAVSEDERNISEICPNIEDSDDENDEGDGNEGEDDQGTEEQNENSLSVNPQTITRGESIEIRSEVTDQVAESGYKIRIEEGEDSAVFESETLNDKEQSLSMEVKTPGTLKVVMMPEGGLVNSLLGALTGEKTLDSERLIVEEDRSAWETQCDSQGYESSVSGKSECIENNIVPKCFEGSTEDGCSEIGQSLCQDLLGYNYNAEQARCVS